MKKSYKKLWIQFLEYVVAGGAWFWSGYFIIVFMTPIIGLWWANIIGNTVGLTINFILERNWVFTGSKKRNLTNLSSKYLIFTVINFLLNYLILRSLQNLGIKVAIGQFIAAAFFTLWNYLWYRFYIFKGTKHHRRLRHHV